MNFYQYFIKKIYVSKNNIHHPFTVMTTTPIKKLKLFLLLITLPALVLVLATYLYKINAPVKQTSAKNATENLPVNNTDLSAGSTPYSEHR